MEKSAMNPVGQFYSKLMLGNHPTLSDSKKLRVRLAANFNTTISRISSTKDNFDKYLKEEGGIKLARLGGYLDIEGHFEKSDLATVFDTVTAFWRFLWNRNEGVAISWKEQVERIFLEEKMLYSIDEKCGVKNLIDEEFSKNVQASINALALSKYSAALHDFNLAIENVGSIPPDTKSAVRYAFLATENVFKIITGKTRLGEAEAKDKLLPLIENKFSSISEKNSNKKILESFYDWINAAHFHRHAEADKEKFELSLDTSVMIVSTSAAYIRWLLSLNVTTK